MPVYYKNGVKYVGSAATREQNKDKKITTTQNASTPTGTSYVTTKPTTSTTNNTAISATSRTPSKITPTSTYVTTKPDTTSTFKSAADAIDFITKQKGNWESANQANDENGKDFAANQAKAAYAYLENNGLSNVASQLHNSGYADAKNINNRWQSYLKSTTETEPINPIYVDNPVYVEDDNVQKVNKANTDLLNKYTQAYDYLMKTNPFTTDEAKAILSKYDLSGLQAKDNELASGGADNGGNIDSFAAANALRQQSALINQGQQVVLQQYQQKLDHVRNLLSDMGVNIDRVYNQDENSKTNTVDRNILLGEHLGYATDEAIKLSRGLWNADGTLKPYNVEGGYQTTINELEDALSKTTDETQKSKIIENLRLLEMARNQKISETGSNYGMTFKYQTSQPTYTNTNDAANRQSAENLAGQDAEVKNNAAALDYQKAIDSATIAGNADITSARIKTQNEALTGTEKESAKIEIDQIMSQWLYSPLDTDNQSAYKGYTDQNRVEYIAAEKLNDAEVINIITKNLTDNGYTTSETQNKIKEYRDNVARQIAKIEGKDYQDSTVINAIKQRYGW